MIQRLKDEPEVSIRRALILAIGNYENLAESDRQALGTELLSWYKTDRDAGIHAAAGWALRRWGQQAEIDDVDKALSTGKIEDERNWYVTQANTHTLAVISGPVEFQMGSPTTEKDREPDEMQHGRRIERRFAIATTEVTVAQYRSFIQDTGISFSFTEKYLPDDECPQGSLNWYQAAQYCRWLSEQEGLAGRLLPNDLGLFDMQGNVWEWCQDGYASYTTSGKSMLDRPSVDALSERSSRVLRGGSFNSRASSVRSACRNYSPPGYRNDYFGFRLDRTYNLSL